MSARVYPRKFDYDEARRRHDAGESIAALARSYSVSGNSIRRAIDPAVRARVAARNRAWIAGGSCVECGARCTRGAANRSGRCKACGSRRLATSARDGELMCTTCKAWKPDHAFPHDRSKKYGRRGRHTVCRGCQAEMRRKARHSRRIPCVSCGAPRAHPNDRGGNAGNKTDTGLCLDCWRDSVRAA